MPAPDRSKRPTRPLGLATLAVLLVGGFLVGSAATEPSSIAKSDVGDAFRIRRHGPPPAMWAAASRTDSQCWVSKTAEKGFHRLTNEVRERLGRARLRLDPELSKVARKHTREMTDQNLLHHTTADAMRRRVTFWAILGENVGVGGTVESLQTAFMNSPAHKENIVHGSFRHIGVGTASAAGRLWVTIVFQARDNPGTTLRMPRC